jgi:hypothetical protein
VGQLLYNGEFNFLTNVRLTCSTFHHVAFAPSKGPSLLLLADFAIFPPNCGLPFAT